MNNYSQEAKQIIADHIYMTIATASKNGQPWISPVFFAYDDKYNLYWVSYKNARHSSLIKDNPQVSIVIFNSQAPEGEGDGVYFEAEVEEITENKEIQFAMNVLGKRVTKEEFRVKKVEEVTEEGAWRIYKAKPLKITKLSRGTTVNGQYIDERVEVSL